MVFVDVDCLKRKNMHETGIIEHNVKRGFDHFRKDVRASCANTENLSFPLQSPLLECSRLISNDGKYGDLI